MNTELQANPIAAQFSAEQLRAVEQQVPAIVEELTIEELAVREEYAACYTVK